MPPNFDGMNLMMFVYFGIYIFQIAIYLDLWFELSFHHFWSKSWILFMLFFHALDRHKFSLWMLWSGRVETAWQKEERIDRKKNCWIETVIRLLYIHFSYRKYIQKRKLKALSRFPYPSKLLTNKQKKEDCLLL